MALYTAAVLASCCGTAASTTRWKATFAHELFRLAPFVFMLSLLWHAWVGVRNIAMDYLKPVSVRLTFEGRGDRC
jgi:succinate dehydrogenase / fumarate reductase membrane anchor subunit